MTSAEKYDEAYGKCREAVLATINAGDCSLVQLVEFLKATSGGCVYPADLREEALEAYEKWRKPVRKKVRK